MQFEWYRAVSFTSEHAAQSALKFLNDHRDTQLLTISLRRDVDAFGLYVSSPDAVPLVHNVLTNSEFGQTQRHESELLTTPNDRSSSHPVQPKNTVPLNALSEEQQPHTHQQADHAAFMHYQQFFIRRPHLVPLTVIFMALGLVGAVIPMLFWESRFFYEMLFLSHSAMLEKQHYWQLMTPTFIHFGWLHIIFNGLWIGILGARVEYSLGFFKTLSVFVFISVVANIVQYMLSAGTPFGGLSGLVYGLIGFLIVQRKCQPTPVNTIGTGMIITMLVFMLLGLFGIMDIFIAGSIANGAHVSGFLSGIFIASILYIKSLQKVFTS